MTSTSSAPVAFPTLLHGHAAEAVVEFSMRSEVEAVVLVNSCARGTATAQSDLDVALLVDPALSGDHRRSIEASWKVWYESRSVFRDLERLSRFSRIHLDLFDGAFRPEPWDDGGGPDSFEIEIGNRVDHGVALWERSRAFADLRARWLPYYDDGLRRERLAMVRSSCRLNLDRVDAAVSRRLYFHAFARLYHAFQEFLQALFIARRVYPIAYDKWVREQVVDWLGLPELYVRLPAILEVHHLESDELRDRAAELLDLLEGWTRSDRA
jgi:predicted nucleotidyltransferase